MSSPYNRKDHLYQKAKEVGYRSRAAFKLLELDKRFHFLKKGGKVLDLGAWPGGWVQVAAEKVGYEGKVVGIDLTRMESLDTEQVLCITGNVLDEEPIKKALAFAEDQFGVVLSDMSPKLTGIREVDAAATTACAELALFTAGKTLKPGGFLIIKVFKSNDTEQFIRDSRRFFQKVHRCELDATRKTSNEFYFVGVGFSPE